MDNRIIALEKKSAFQEDLLAQLNQALIDQQKKLLSLEFRLNAMSAMVVRGDFVKRPEDETPPPHY